MALLDISKTYKPFQYPWAVEITKKHEEIHWVEDEAELSEDVQDWRTKLSDGEKEFITQILRLFTQSDVQVGENYHELLIPKFKNNEVRNMLSSFANREGVHQRAYALLNDTLGLPDEEYHAFLEYSEMADKIEFMSQGDISSHTGLALALAQSVFNEGMSLFASFVMLLNFQRFGKMKGMGTIVEWSIRDETIHVQGNAKLFREFCDEHPRIVTDEFKKEIYLMAREAVKLEDKFLDLAFNGHEVQGLTKDEVKKYIRHIADRRLLQLGLKTNYKQKENPLPWLDWILNGASHDNFFEKRVTEYSVNGMEGDWGWEDESQYLDGVCAVKAA
jgi:ribonucleotide reductase beta subunit family protein with ferritin-like domain